MKQIYSCFLFCIFLCPAVRSQSTGPVSTSVITGRVFRDYNLDGKQDFTSKSNEGGVSGITVTAIGSDGKVLQKVTTSEDGNYQLTVPEAGDVKVRFSSIDAGNAISGDTVRFVKSPANEINLGLTRYSSYSAGSQNIFSSIFRNGSPGQTKRIDSLTSLVSSRVDSLGLTTSLALFGQTGAVWGLAYASEHNVLFSAAITKRHSGFGPLGSGGIYVTQLDSLVTKPFFSLSDYGIATAGELKRDFPETYQQISRDSAAFDQVGKSGLGGIALSADKLFVTNLYDQTVYAFKLTAALVKPTSYEKLSFRVKGCANGKFRPFALKYNDGRLFAGGVCDAQVSQNAKHLQGIVFELDTIKKEFQQLLAFPLDYSRGKIVEGAEASGWNPWTSSFGKAIVQHSPSTAAYPQPILASLDFDEEGNMLMGMMDRFGHQAGTGHPNPEGTGTFVAISGGDILKATRKKERKYTIDEVVKGGKRARGNDSFNSSQHFDTAFESEGIVLHASNTAGGAALLRNTNMVVATLHEPARAFNTSGIQKLDNATGEPVGATDLFRTSDPATFGKINAVGSIEVGRALPGIVIGNRVWLDENGDGLQDAGEPGLSGLMVQLLAGDTLVATVSTDSLGGYAFKDVSVREKPYQVRVQVGTASRKSVSLSQTVKVAAGNRRWDVDFGVPCELTALCEQQADGAVSPGLVVYPNPVRSTMNFYYRGAKPGMKLTASIHDLSGRSIFQKDIIEATAEGSLQVNTDQWPLGIYILTVRGDAFSASTKFSKQ